MPCKKHACRIRLGVIESTHSAKSGHPGGSLSIAEVLSFFVLPGDAGRPRQPHLA